MNTPGFTAGLCALFFATPVQIEAVRASDGQGPSFRKAAPDPAMTGNA